MQDQQPTSHLKTVSIVIPALNEEEGICGTIDAISTKQLAEYDYECELIVVDNGSTDRTAELAREAGARVVFEPRRGYGSALKAGFRAATGDFIATLDADLTYPAYEIPRLVCLLEEKNLDFISTNRLQSFSPGAFSARNLVGNRLLSLVAGVVYRLPFKDSQSGMWIFRRDVLSKMVLRSDGMALSEEIKVEAAFWAKLRCLEVPISYEPRAGKVKLRAYMDGLENLLFLLKKRFWR
jgi:glycosyltransferase involved in cell wall biosynthesis